MPDLQTAELEARLLARCRAAFPELDWLSPSIFPLPAYMGDPTPAWIVWESRLPAVVGQRACLLFDECPGINLITITAVHPNA